MQSNAAGASIGPRKRSGETAEPSSSLCFTYDDDEYCDDDSEFRCYYELDECDVNDVEL